MQICKLEILSEKMANNAMDIDSDDLASLAKLETFDGTSVLTGSMKKTTYVP